MMEKEESQMKDVYRHGVLWALFMILVLAPVSSDAAFLVQFQNGRTVRVDSYRKDGKSYELYLESGSLWVPAEEIKSILEKKDDVVRLPKEETEKDEPKTAGDPGKQKVPRNSVPQDTEIESYIQKKAELRERLEEAKNVYFAATEKSEKDWARQRMISYSRELFSLEAEVKGKHNGSLPDWWKEN
jgi:hypothetical protein